MLENVAKSGNIPQALRNRPTVEWWYISLVLDFSRLHQSRTYGMSGPNPLDLPSIIAYNEAVSKEPMEFFIDIMQELDSTFLKAERKKAERKGKKTKVPNSSSTRVRKPGR